MPLSPPIEDYVIWQKATLLDMVYLQQDAFDAVDASMSLERQLESFQLLKGLIDREYLLLRPVGCRVG